MAKRKVTPKTPTLDSGYLPQSAQKLNVYTPSVLNLPNAGVYVPNQELKQVLNLLDTAGKSTKSIMSSVKGDASANLGWFRQDGSEDREHYLNDLETGEARTKENEDDTSLEEEFFALVEKTGNVGDAAHYITTGIAAETLGVEQDEEGHLIANDDVSQMEINAYMNSFYEGTAAGFRAYYDRYDQERKLVYTDGVVYDLVFASDNELKSGQALYEEALEAPGVNPDRKEIYTLGINVTAIQKATEAGLYDRAEKLMKRLPENYSGRIGLDTKLIEGRRESAMADLSVALTELTGGTITTWVMNEQVENNLVAATSDPRDSQAAASRLASTLENSLLESHLSIGKKDQFLKRFRNQTDGNGVLLFPRHSHARDAINDLIEKLPDEYEQQRLQIARDSAERTEARQLSLAYLLDKQVVVKGADGNDQTITTPDAMSDYLRSTYNLGNDFALEMMELNKKITGLQGDSAGNEEVYADFMTQIKTSNVAKRRGVGDKIIKSLDKGDLTIAQANTLWRMNTLETSYEDDKFSPEAMGLFDQVYNAYWRAAGAEPMMPGTASGQRMLWAMPKDAAPGSDRDWMKLEAQLRGDWRKWITDPASLLLKETDPNAYLTARTAEIIRLADLYLGTEDMSKVPMYDITKDPSAYRRGNQWSPKETK
jgi:hypothetical protein